MKKIFRDDDCWFAFFYGTIIGMLAGITIVYAVVELFI